MYELIKIKENNYYIDCPSKIGLYVIDDMAYLIDSGNNKGVGKKIIKILEENNLKLKCIINTHYHNDHIGGNKILQEKTCCDIYASDIENTFIENPILEPALFYGAYPYKEIRGTSFVAKPSNVSYNKEIIPKELEIISLKGHSPNMIGVKTKDNIYYIADSIFDSDVIDKYCLTVIYNVKDFLDTLDYLLTLKGNFYIPSHSEATDNIKEIVNKNKDNTFYILNEILNLLDDDKTFEHILCDVFEKFNIEMNVKQNILLSSTIKAYLSYLIDEKKAITYIKNNYMYYKKGV